MVANLLEKERKNFLDAKKIENPDFLNKNPIDSVSSSVAKDVRETLQIQIDYDIEEGRDPEELDLGALWKSNLSTVDYDVVKEIFKQEIERLRNSE
jgi:hypothetical protein